MKHFDLVGESWTLARTPDGRVARLFNERRGDRRLRFGEQISARIASVAPKQGGAFLETERGDVFLPSKDGAGLVEGDRHLVTIVAEARHGKLARCTLESGNTNERDALSPMEQWRASLPQPSSGLEIADLTELDHLEEALDEVLAPRVTLANGGRIQISPTPALVAVDIDTAGRNSRGRAQARALAVNLDAAKELARQAALRDLGGLIVLDCIGPLAAADGRKIRSAFLTTFRTVSQRQVTCLEPSSLGLMEIALAWQSAPISDLFYDDTGQLLPEAQLRIALRAVSREAAACPADTFELKLPDAAYAAFQNDKRHYIEGLRDQFGGRIDVSCSHQDRSEVIRK
ncbi:MAG: ribonuclease E/G [Pseudomonadota bacterium]